MVTPLEWLKLYYFFVDCRETAGVADTLMELLRFLMEDWMEMIKSKVGKML